MEEFIPLHKLATRKRDVLTKKQRELLEARDHAVEMQQALKRFGKSPELDAQVIDRRARARPLEQEAHLAGRKALMAAVGYYAKHGRITEAYEDLRREARQWHPNVGKLWAAEFEYSAARVAAKIPPAIAMKIAVEKKLEAPHAMKLARKTIKFEEELEEPELPRVKN